jgi:hypothetical protein
MIPCKMQVICASCGATATNLGTFWRISVNDSDYVASTSVYLFGIAHPERVKTGASPLTTAGRLCNARIPDSLRKR